MPRSATKRSHGPRKKRRPQNFNQAPKPPVQPVKTRKRWPWLVILTVAVILVSFGIWHAVSGSSSSKSTATAASTLLPSPTPTPKSSWQTLLTFSGNNNTKKTQKFEVPADWQFTWSCRGVKGVDGGLFITIYNANGSLYNAGAQISCLAAKQIIGSAEEHQSGDVYLTINSNDPWTVTVQKPQ
jgi:hypothetical protein